jgi:hypothetical protein
MIKVEHTKNYRLSQDQKKYSNSPYEVLVTDAELVLVECKPEEALFNLIENGLPNGILRLHTKDRFVAGRYLKPILISRTEKITTNKGKEMGDWTYNSFYKKMFQMNGDITNYDFKILALPEHFSPESLQLIVDGKLKEGKCLVECIEHKEKPYGIPYNVVALNPHITIYPDYIQSAIKICKEHDCEVSVENTDSVEEKMYTRDEVKRLLMKLPNFYQYSIIQQAEMFEKWFEQNVK